MIGFGGTHYAVRQSAIGIETKGAMGHMMHTRDVGNATSAIVSQMIEKSGPAVAAHVDRKALSKPEISHIESILKELGVEELTEGDLLKINHMSYEMWKKYRNIAADTGFDLRLFPHGDILDDEPSVVALPDDFFSAAFGKNDSALMDYLESIGGVFHTTNTSGKLMPIFLTNRTNCHNLSEGLIALSIQYITRTQDSLVDGDTIILRRKQFDAQKARKMGVPNGPLFGKLIAGEAITLPDGKTVNPEDVTNISTISVKIPGLE